MYFRAASRSRTGFILSHVFNLTQYRKLNTTNARAVTRFSARRYIYPTRHLKRHTAQFLANEYLYIRMVMPFFGYAENAHLKRR